MDTLSQYAPRTGNAFPALLHAPDAAFEMQLRWLDNQRDAIHDACLSSGAVLLRGLGHDSDAGAAALTRALLSDPLAYTDGDSPRSRIAAGLYTSTEFPARFEIALHNELSYAPSPPELLLFICAVAPASGGATVLADARRVLSRLDRSIVDELNRRGIRYIRNLHGSRGAGRSWQDTYETVRREDVEHYTRLTGTELQWFEDGAARVIQRGKATRVHPVTGEEVWFNQADLFHPSTHPPEIAQALTEVYEDDLERLPHYVTYGDGSSIPAEIFDAVRAAGAAERVPVEWKTGDVLLVDNLLCLHGRMPYEGERRILVSMSSRRTP